MGAHRLQRTARTWQQAPTPARRQRGVRQARGHGPHRKDPAAGRARCTIGEGRRGAGVSHRRPGGAPCGAWAGPGAGRGWQGQQRGAPGRGRASAQPSCRQCREHREARMRKGRAAAAGAGKAGAGRVARGGAARGSGGGRGGTGRWHRAVSCTFSRSAAAAASMRLAADQAGAACLDRSVLGGGGDGDGRSWTAGPAAAAEATRGRRGGAGRFSRLQSSAAAPLPGPCRTPCPPCRVGCVQDLYSGHARAGAPSAPTRGPTRSRHAA